MVLSDAYRGELDRIIDGLRGERDRLREALGSLLDYETGACANADEHCGDYGAVEADFARARKVMEEIDQ